MKGAHGGAKMDVTEKTKVHTDGTVEKSTEVEGSSKAEPAH